VGASRRARRYYTGEQGPTVRRHITTIDLPGFTADASLYETGGHYRTCVDASGRPAGHMGTIRLSAIDVPGEVIEIEDDAPWSPPSWGGHTGPASGGGSGETGPGGGGPGGGDGGIPDPNDKPAPHLHGCSPNQIMSDAAKPCEARVESDLMHGVKNRHFTRCTGEQKGNVVHPVMECCQKKGKRLVCTKL
jgi:hypothetical protein